MQSAENHQVPNIETLATRVEGRSRVTATDDWMPESNNGPYSTIPFSTGIDPRLLEMCGLSSFAGARQEIKAAADDYVAWAVTLVAKARRERLDLSQEIRGDDGGLPIRPYRVRLCLGLERSTGRLQIYWRGAVKKRGRWSRIRARIWDCKADVDPLIASVHPAEGLLIRRLETEAAFLRRRWFALVRGVHYMNVIEDHRLEDYEGGKVQDLNNRRLVFRLMRRMQGAITSRLRRS